MAFSKAKRSALCGKVGIDWISANYRIFKYGVTVSVKQTLIDDVYQMAMDFSKKNVVAVCDLRSFAGKVNNLCSVIYTLTPFLRQIWGCLSADALPVKGAPPNTVWRKQFQEALSMATSRSVAPLRIALVWVEPYRVSFKPSKCLSKSREGITLIIAPLSQQPISIGI